VPAAAFIPLLVKSISAVLTFCSEHHPVASQRVGSKF
jgi:hypothetical protein